LQFTVPIIAGELEGCFFVCVCDPGERRSESSAVLQDVNKQGCWERFTSFEMLSLSLRFRSPRLSPRYNHCAKLDCYGCCSCPPCTYPE